jgi:3-oxoacyl-[acyl-carrier protein] reductase
MDISLTGKRAIICGSSAGIGLATARELSFNGASCILFARNAAELQKVVSGLPKPYDQKHRFMVVDFSQPAQVEEAVKKIVGEGEVEILVNNTGGPKAGPILNATSEDFENAFRQHLVCNQILVQAVMPGMRLKNYGRIINIISTSVKTPLSNLGVSNTIRLAVAAWSKTVANEIGSFNITINNVLPGLTETQRLQGLIRHTAESMNREMDIVQSQMKESIPLKRFGKPEEIANMIVFLASPAASYINGTNIAVDGGRTPAL